MAKEKSSSGSGASPSKPRKTTKKSSKVVSTGGSKVASKNKSTRRGLYVRASRHFAARKAKSVQVVDLSEDEGPHLDGPSNSHGGVPLPPAIDEPEFSQANSLVEYEDDSSSDHESHSSNHEDASAVDNGAHAVSVSVADDATESVMDPAPRHSIHATPGAAGDEVHHSTPLATGVPPVQGSGVSPVNGPEHHAGITLGQAFMFKFIFF